MTVTATSSVRLHALVFKEEEAGTWIVGRIDTGEFVELPAEAVTFLRALDADGSIDRAHERVHAQHGKDVDAIDFVDALVDLGFVASLDGHPVGTTPKPPSLRWLRPEHVRWVFRWPALVCVYALIVGGLVASAVRGNLIPSYRVFFITGSQSANLAWNTAMVLAAIAIHEFWHLAAARADGVYGRIGLGTRLQFLVAQTTVAGLWGAPRRVRLRVYLAGITSDLVIMAVCSLAISIAAPAGLAYRALEALMLLLLLSVASQFMLFMRTDMYFVLQEVLRCRNLYADAWDYARYAAGKVAATALRREPPLDPTGEISRHERKSIKAYSGPMILGSLATIGLFSYYEGLIIITLIYRAGQHAVNGIISGNVTKAADGIAVFAVEGTLQIIFLRLFFAKHAEKLRRAIGFLRRKSRIKPVLDRC